MGIAIWETRYLVKWRDTIVMREHLAILDKKATERRVTDHLSDDEYIGLTNREY